MIEWNIQSRAHVCQACQKSFADKETFHTLLFDQKHAFERLDVCNACWKEKYQDASSKKGFISYWQSVYTVPPPAPPEAIQKDTAESLLRKLVEQNDPAHSAARFILAVMLERKRLLKVKAQINEGKQRVLIYEHIKSGDLFNIPDPDLQLDQLEQVQRDVAMLLEHGLPVKNEAKTTNEGGDIPAQESEEQPPASEGETSPAEPSAQTS